MKLTFVTMAVCLVGSAALAGGVMPADVKFEEDGAVTTSLSGMAGDATSGADIIASKSRGNCVACHEITALSDTPFHGEIGPTLDGAGDRWSQDQLRGLIADAKMTFDGSLMPSFYKVSGFVRPGDAYTGKAAEGELAPLLSSQDIEDVVAFLMTLKDN